MLASESLPRMSLPPPAAYRLFDGTGTVGWIHGQELAFTGFSSTGEAAAAAWVAHVALERRAAKSRREPAPYLEPEALQLVSSGGSEWIYSGATPLARLIRPAEPATGESEDSWFGIDVVLPPDSSELAIGSGAHVVYRALRRSGVRWPIRNHRALLSDRMGDGLAEELVQAPLTALEIPDVEGRSVIMSEQRDRPDDEVESASLDSFPASDPPKWGSLRLGPPRQSEPSPEAAKQKEAVADRRPFDSGPVETHDVGGRA